MAKRGRPSNKTIAKRRQAKSDHNVSVMSKIIVVLLIILFCSYVIRHWDELSESNEATKEPVNSIQLITE